MIATDTPTQIDRDAFLTALRAAELLSDRQFGRALHELSPSVQSAREVAAHFRRGELLTRFQTDRLLAGRTDGFHIGPYLVLDYLGKSATGRVYKARHRTMNRVVAIKILSIDETATEAVRDGIRAEARSAARLAHTNIVTLLDANQVGERMYFVKEYLDGGDLAALVRAKGPLGVRRACETIRQAALGLQHAHEKGTAHGRLSPTAILVGRACLRGADDKPLVKVSGFGLRRLGADCEEPDYEYRAPEQFADPEHASAAADLYSLGCILHDALAGMPPFPSTTLAEARAHHTHSVPTPLGHLRPDVPAPLANFVLHLLAKDPLARPASAEIVSHFLGIYAEGDESGAGHEIGLTPPPPSGAASVVGRSLLGLLADLPHEPILFDDDLAPAPTMVIEAVPIATPYPAKRPLAAEVPTVQTAGASEPTPVTMPKRKSKAIAKPAARRKSARPRYGEPPPSNWLALGALVVGVTVGVLFAIFCLLKIYAATKG